MPLPLLLFARRAYASPSAPACNTETRPMSRSVSRPADTHYVPPESKPVPQPDPLPAAEPAPEFGGRNGPDPVRYGDWEKSGIAVDF